MNTYRKNGVHSLAYSGWGCYIIIVIMYKIDNIWLSLIIAVDRSSYVHTFLHDSNSTLSYPEK